MSNFDLSLILYISITLAKPQSFGINLLDTSKLKNKKYKKSDVINIYYVFPAVVFILCRTVDFVPAVSTLFNNNKNRVGDFFAAAKFQSFRSNCYCNI